MIYIWLLIVTLWNNRPQPIPYDYCPTVEEYVSPTVFEEELQLMRITCYLPTGNKTASGQPVHIGGCAGRREDIGKIAALYTKDHEFVGYFEINDCGGATSLKNGTSLDIFQWTMDDAWAWVHEYGDYMYVQIIDANG